jgi:hypothetical protein
MPLAAAHGAEAEDVAEEVRRTVAKLAELGLVTEAGVATGGSPGG